MPHVYNDKAQHVEANIEFVINILKQIRRFVAISFKHFNTTVNLFNDMKHGIPPRNGWRVFTLKE